MSGMCEHFLRRQAVRHGPAPATRPQASETRGRPAVAPVGGVRRPAPNSVVWICRRAKKLVLRVPDPCYCPTDVDVLLATLYEMLTGLTPRRARNEKTREAAPDG